MFELKSVLLFRSNLSLEEIMNLLIPEAENYVEFYNKLETEKLTNLVRLFSIYNAESTAVATASANSKNGTSMIKKYANDIESRFSDVEQTDDNYIEDQFKVFDGK